MLDDHRTCSLALRLMSLIERRPWRILSDLFRSQLEPIPAHIPIETWVPPMAGAGFWQPDRLPRPDQVAVADRIVVGHQIVAEHAGFLARGLDREAPQQGQQRGHIILAQVLAAQVVTSQVVTAQASATRQHALDHAPLEPRHAALPVRMR